MSSKPFLLVACLLVAAIVAPLRAHAVPLAVSGPDGAEVRLNGEFVGFLPFGAPLDVEPGRYELRCELPGYQSFIKSVRLINDRDGIRVVARMIPLSRRTALGADLLLAGTGQHYAGQNLRGWIYNTAEIGGLLIALTGELQRSNHRKDYLLLIDEYNSHINADEIAYYRAAAQQAWNDMEDAESLRDTGLMVAGGAVLLSVLDTLFLFPAIEAGPGAPATSLLSGGPSLLADDPTWHVAIRASF